jgi:hypothetical protein
MSDFNDERNQDHSGTEIIVWVYLAILAGIILLSCQTAHAEISEETAVKCLLGETRSEPSAFLAHAEVLRSRNSTKGIYGCNVKLSPTEARFIEKKGIRAKALKAWRDSKTSNITKGATHWEGKAFKKPYWAKNMTVVYETKLTRFYKERN